MCTCKIDFVERFEIVFNPYESCSNTSENLNEFEQHIRVNVLGCSAHIYIYIYTYIYICIYMFV